MTKSKQFKFLAFLSLGIMAASFGPLTVFAQTESNETTQTTVTKTLAERLAERKANQQTRLTNAQQTRLKARCKAAQGLLGSLNTRVKGIEKNRSAVYDKVVTRLNELVAKVGTRADTADLQTQITALEEKITAFKTDIATYKQAVADLVEMDCASDPAAFKASLEEAKASHAKLLQTSKSIREYINQTIKPTLQTIKTQLTDQTQEAG